MYADLGLKVIGADFDPQANLTSMFIDEDRLEGLWPDGRHPHTIYGALRPILEGTGDISEPHVEDIDDNIGLIVGDLHLARAEDELSSQWPECLDRKERAFRVISILFRILAKAVEMRESDLVLMDVGPNLGALNRAALIAADHVAVPLAPDIYSLQGLRNLGPTLRRWREEWKERLEKVPDDLNISLPTGSMEPLGYIVLQHSVRLDRPVKAYGRWMERIPGEYRVSVLDMPEDNPPSVNIDAKCLSMLKHYRSLMPMAMESHKPMFYLRPADGAIGAHMGAVHGCYRDFKALALTIASQCGLELPAATSANTTKEE